MMYNLMTIKVSMLLLFCFKTGAAGESDVPADSGFTFHTDYNQHEGAEELSISFRQDDQSHAVSIIFIIFTSPEASEPWYRIDFRYSGSSFLDIPVENSLVFTCGNDTVLLSSYDNGQRRHQGETSVTEELGYNVSDDDRQAVAAMDSSAVITVRGARQELRIDLQPEDWRKIRWFYHDVAWFYREAARQYPKAE